FRVDSSSYSREMAEVVKKINDGKFDIAVEMHFNAGGGSGTTVLYWHKSESGKKLSDLFQETMVKNTGMKKKELIQVKGADQNGAYGIMNSKCPYILIEPFFGDSREDTDKINVARMGDVLFKYFNIINNVETVVKPNDDSCTNNNINNSEIKQKISKISKELDEILKNWR
ncbi:MAG: N-acetylmuramoyl-L-alanine amidase, partial [Cetobacterium sp.]